MQWVPLCVCYIFSLTMVHSQIASMFKDDMMSGFCCNNRTSSKVRPGPASLAEVVAESPIYEQIAPTSIYVEQLDNVCDTFYKIDNNSYLRLTGLTYVDGSFIIEKFIASELPNIKGVFRYLGLAQTSGSSTIVYDEVYMCSVCPGVRVYYRNIIAGRCDLLTSDVTDIDYIHSESSSRDTPAYCNSEVVEFAKRRKFRVTGFSEFPKKLNRHCVTKLNGVSCINADKVLPQDSYTLPDTGPSCQTYNTY